MMDILRVSRSQIVKQLPSQVRQFPWGVIESGGDDNFPVDDAFQEDLQRRTVFGVSVEMRQTGNATSGIVDHDEVETATGAVQPFWHHEPALDES